MTTHSILRDRLTPPGALCGPETDATPDPANGRGSVEIVLRGDGTAGYPLPDALQAAAGSQAITELRDLERMICRKYLEVFPGEDLPTPKRALMRLLDGVVITEIYPTEN